MHWVSHLQCIYCFTILGKQKLFSRANGFFISLRRPLSQKALFYRLYSSVTLVLTNNSNLCCHFWNQFGTSNSTTSGLLLSLDNNHKRMAVGLTNNPSSVGFFIAIGFWKITGLNCISSIRLQGDQSPLPINCSIAQNCSGTFNQSMITAY